jgi:hypothetical protein
MLNPSIPIDSNHVKSAGPSFSPPMLGIVICGNFADSPLLSHIYCLQGISIPATAAIFDFDINEHTVLLGDNIYFSK